MAAIACIAVMLGHELLGSAKVLDPLHQVALSADVVWLHHFSWHVGSISLVATAAMFVLGGRKTEHLILATFGTAISTSFAILGICLAVFGDVALWNTPAPYPWTPIAALGGTGLYFAHKGAHR
jgi:hypothetical protein